MLINLNQNMIFYIKNHNHIELFVHCAFPIHTTFMITQIIYDID